MDGIDGWHGWDGRTDGWIGLINRMGGMDGAGWMDGRMEASKDLRMNG